MKAPGATVKVSGSVRDPRNASPHNQGIQHRGQLGILVLVTFFTFSFFLLILLGNLSYTISSSELAQKLLHSFCSHQFYISYHISALNFFIILAHLAANRWEDGVVDVEAVRGQDKSPKTLKKDELIWGCGCFDCRDLIGCHIILLQYDRLELQQSKLLYLSSETSPEASK